MATTLKLQYGTATALTVTGIGTLTNGSSAISATVDNTTTLYLDVKVELVFATAATGTVATGTVELWAKESIDNTDFDDDTNDKLVGVVALAAAGVQTRKRILQPRLGARRVHAALLAASHQERHRCAAFTSATVTYRGALCCSRSKLHAVRATPPETRWKPEPWPWTWSALAEPYASIAKSCTFLLPMWEHRRRSALPCNANAADPADRDHLWRPVLTAAALTRTAGTLDHLIGPAGFQPVANPNAGYTLFGVANPAASTVAAGSGTLFLMRRTVPYIQYGIMFNFDISAVEGSSGSLTAYQEQTSNTRFNATAASMVNGQWHSFASRLSGSSLTAWRDGAIVATNNSGPTTTLVDPAQILCIGGLNASGYGVRLAASPSSRPLTGRSPIGKCRPCTPIRWV
jgi:hypothetical protein